jgi:hypothetical protein
LAVTSEPSRVSSSSDRPASRSGVQATLLDFNFSRACVVRSNQPLVGRPKNKRTGRPPKPKGIPLRITSRKQPPPTTTSSPVVQSKAQRIVNALDSLLRTTSSNHPVRVARVAKTFNVPRTTLKRYYRRALNAGVNSGKGALSLSADCRVLDKEQESKIVNILQFSFLCCAPFRHSDVPARVKKLFKKTVSASWVSRLIKRTPTLSTRKGDQFDRNRITACQLPRLDQYFHETLPQAFKFINDNSSTPMTQVDYFLILLFPLLKKATDRP